MKKLLIAFVLFLAVAFSAFAEPLTLAENGKTAYKIVLPDQPKGFDRMAADDLKNYLGKMTGADFQIVPESQASGRDLIYVGQTGFARKQGIDFAALGAEEWVWVKVPLEGALTPPCIVRDTPRFPHTALRGA